MTYTLGIDIGTFESKGVLVDAKDVDVVSTTQERVAVPASAEGGVDDGACGHGVENRGDLIDHHRVVFEQVCHSSSSPVAS